MAALNAQPTMPCLAPLVNCRLCERQTKSGGLNGRPEKLQDVCYSWWCLSALSILGRLHWIDQQALTDFILDCQVSMHRQGWCGGGGGQAGWPAGRSACKQAGSRQAGVGGGWKGGSTGFLGMHADVAGSVKISSCGNNTIVS